MPVSSTASKTVGRGNGVTTGFAYGFLIPDASTLVVTYTDADGVVTVLSPSQYSVSGIGNSNGGTVTYAPGGVPIASGTSLTIMRVIPLTQPVTLLNQGAYYPEVIEAALDRVTMQLQQVAGGGPGSPLALLFPDTDVDPETTLPPAGTRANQFFAFDALGNPTMVPATGLPPDLSVYDVTATGGTTALSFATRFGSMLSVLDFGAAGNGVHDDTSAIQAAITYLAALGGGGVYFPRGTYKITSSLTMKSEVMLWGQHGAEIAWSGSAAVMFGSATTTPLERAGMKGLKISMDNASKALELRSAWRFTCEDVEFDGASATSIVIDLLCNSSGALNQDGNYNSVYGSFFNVLQTGDCGTLLRLKGNAVSPGQVVVLNSFGSINAQGCHVRGIDFAEWCDSNTFYGMVRVNVIGTGGVGVEINTANPTGENGVYALTFQHLAVDTFALPGISGRTGLKLNLCKQIKVERYYNDPEAENGDLVVSNLCYSYDIQKSIPGNNFEQRMMLGQFLCIGGTGTTKYSIYTSSFTLRGANQASIVLSDTFNSEAAGTSCTGVTVANHTQAGVWSLGTYYGHTVTDLDKGAGSTVTNQVAYNVDDLAAGVNNFGYRHAMAAGPSKWGFYGEGTAPNFFNGGLVVAEGDSTATSGFNHVSADAGAPSGVPDLLKPGNNAMYYDDTGDFFYVYNRTAAAWRKVALIP